MKDLSTSSIPLTQARDRKGQLIAENEIRKRLREADLVDGVWHDYELHLKAFAETGSAECFCVKPPMVTVKSRELSRSFNARGLAAGTPNP